jgi:hypothetical protein
MTKATPGPKQWLAALYHIASQSYHAIDFFDAIDAVRQGSERLASVWVRATSGDMSPEILQCFRSAFIHWFN